MLANVFLIDRLRQKYKKLEVREITNIRTKEQKSKEMEWEDIENKIQEDRDNNAAIGILKKGSSN